MKLFSLYIVLAAIIAIDARYYNNIIEAIICLTLTTIS